MAGNHRLFAAFATALLVVGALSTGAAALQSDTSEGLAVDVSQSDSVTVLVTDNGSAVENASVAVEAPVVNNSTYAGVGDYTTGPNGTVDLATPEENVTITVAAEYGNQTVTTTATLVADGEPKNFGERVSSFVQQLKNAGTDGNTSLGQIVSEFVTENNPGADHRPDHAGPTAAGPNDAGNGSADDDRGRPAHAGNGNGNDKNDDDETDRNENAKKNRGKK
ncbi:hypothetical protein ACFPYI_08830 [Halomarina salina]|uniref:Carboxypeptidase regulatory-like domain-containing protein n=1 Tax=Halomarina salina TaxID=1872699 RepID=A0ABD5RLZ5_9EURY|nr:hypothetical protein [Halomarina salina]